MSPSEVRRCAREDWFPDSTDTDRDFFNPFTKRQPWNSNWIEYNDEWDRLSREHKRAEESEERKRILEQIKEEDKQ